MEIGYTEQRENHGPMILYGVSFSIYTLRSVGSYYTYGVTLSVQSSMIYSGLIWSSMDVPCVSPSMLRYSYNTILYIIFPKTLDLPSGESVSITSSCYLNGFPDGSNIVSTV